MCSFNDTFSGASFFSGYDRNGDSPFSSGDGLDVLCSSNDCVGIDTSLTSSKHLTSKGSNYEFLCACGLSVRRGSIYCVGLFVAQRKVAAFPRATSIERVVGCRPPGGDKDSAEYRTQSPGGRLPTIQRRIFYKTCPRYARFRKV